MKSVLVILAFILSVALAFHSPTHSASRSSVSLKSAMQPTTTTLDSIKYDVLQLGAALDRGQAYNPTSGEYYASTMKVAREKIEELISSAPSVPTALEDLDGEWELVLSTVPHGIFRSSPFFLAVQEAFQFAENKTGKRKTTATRFARHR